MWLMVLIYVGGPLLTIALGVVFYSLVVASHRCPECGRVMSISNRTSRRS